MAIDPSILLQAKQIGFNPIDQVRQEKLKQVQEQAAQGQLTLQNQDIEHNQLVAQQQADAQRQEAAFQAAIKVNPNLDDNAVVGLLGTQRGVQFLKSREETKTSIAKRSKDQAEAKARQDEIERQYTGSLARTIIGANYDPMVISHVLDAAQADPEHAPVVQQIRQALTQGGPEAAKQIFGQLYENSRTTAQADEAKAKTDSLAATTEHNKAIEANQAATNDRLVQSGARQEANDKFRQAVDLKRLGLEQQRVGIEQQKAAKDPENVDVSTADPEQKRIAQMLVDGKIGIKDLPTRGGYRSTAAALASQMDPSFTTDRKDTIHDFKNGEAGKNLTDLTMLRGHMDRFLKNSAETGTLGTFNPFSTSNAKLQADAKDVAAVTNRLVNKGVLSKYQAQQYHDMLGGHTQGPRDAAAQEMFDLATEKITALVDKYEKGTGQKIPDAMLKNTGVGSDSKSSGKSSLPAVGSSFNGAKVLKVTRID